MKVFSIEPPPSRLRRGTPARTPRIPSALLQPLPRRHIQLPLQLRTRFLSMNKVAEPATNTTLAAIQPATRFAEIGNGGKLAVYRAAGVPTRVEGVTGGLGVFFVFEAHVDVADEIWEMLACLR